MTPAGQTDFTVGCFINAISANLKNRFNEPFKSVFEPTYSIPNVY